MLIMFHQYNEFSWEIFRFLHSLSVIKLNTPILSVFIKNYTRFFQKKKILKIYLFIHKIEIIWNIFSSMQLDPFPKENSRKIRKFAVFHFLGFNRNTSSLDERLLQFLRIFVDWWPETRVCRLRVMRWHHPRAAR